MAHISVEQARGLLDGSLPLKESAWVLGHLLTKCERCQALAHEVAFPDPPADLDYKDVLRRLELAYVVAAHDVQEERHLAAESWLLMKNLDSAQRVQLVKHNPNFRYWGLYEKVVEEAKLMIRQDPSRR